jgi:hypothetical protein
MMAGATQCRSADRSPDVREQPPANPPCRFGIAGQFRDQSPVFSNHPPKSSGRPATPIAAANPPDKGPTQAR